MFPKSACCLSRCLSAFLNLAQDVKPEVPGTRRSGYYYLPLWWPSRVRKIRVLLDTSWTMRRAWLLPYCYLIDVRLPVTKLICVGPKLHDTDLQNSHVGRRGLLARDGREIALCIPVSTKEICHRIDLKSLESS